MNVQPIPDSILERLLVEQQERPIPALVPRDVPLPGLPGKADALIGMRRSGKTWRLFGEMQALLGRGVPRERIVYLNLADDRLTGATAETLDRLLELAFRRAPAGRSEGAFLFLDEVQDVAGWERFARRVLDTEPLRLFVTGSSARQLSTEVATAFRGRSITTEILPFSPREAARASGIDGSTPAGAALRSVQDAFLLTYLRDGGFPGLLRAGPYERIQILQEYVDLVVLRDVGERHHATNLPILRELVAALFAANAGGFSVSRLHGALQSQGFRVHKGTLLDYLSHLTDAFLFFLLPLRTRSARQRAVNPRKVYAIDPGLARAMRRAGAEDRGALLENAVYLELRRRYGRLSESVLGWMKTARGYEIDFVVDDPVVGGPPTLIQVCESMTEPETQERELRALTAAMTETGVTNATIVTMFGEGRLELDGRSVHIVPARSFFLGPGAVDAGSPLAEG